MTTRTPAWSTIFTTKLGWEIMKRVCSSWMHFFTTCEWGKRGKENEGEVLVAWCVQQGARNTDLEGLAKVY